MAVISYLLAGVLLALSALHLLWGLRIWWPIADEFKLARATAGFKGIATMAPPAACYVVALLLAIVALIALELGGLGLFNRSALTALVGAGATLVFLGRGLFAYTPTWARLTPEEPFRSLDRRYFSPLCLIIGVGLLVLLVTHRALH
ncbi:DUF3995 domain-containing protein [Lentibacter algarum]|uniref:DUF3995 domain-containing protein n=1 Tax=Lentibacter algarum TaxID=576131 RepID=UPI001C06FEDE|nr:DUF3995 domain-containing protein [Lentibacter algarum]MBU2981139.1 DUF3995 domain-containing protein [Lentibacter algarum]